MENHIHDPNRFDLRLSKSSFSLLELLIFRKIKCSGKHYFPFNPLSLSPIATKGTYLFEIPDSFPPEKREQESEAVLLTGYSFQSPLKGQPERKNNRTHKETPIMQKTPPRRGTKPEEKAGPQNVATKDTDCATGGTTVIRWLQAAVRDDKGATLQAAKGLSIPNYHHSVTTRSVAREKTADEM